MSLFHKLTGPLTVVNECYVHDITQILQKRFTDFVHNTTACEERVTGVCRMADTLIEDKHTGKNTTCIYFRNIHASTKNSHIHDLHLIVVCDKNTYIYKNRELNIVTDVFVL